MGKTLSKPGGGTPPSASGVDHPWAIFPGGAPCQTSDIAGLPWELTNESRNSVCEKGNEAHDGAARAIQSVARRQRARRHVDGVAGALLRPLRVTVLSGKDLRGADFGGASSDPYIIAHVVDDDGAQIFLQRSPVKKMTRSPTWNCDFMLPGVHSDMRLVFTVLDWDRFSSDDFLGQVSLPIPDIRSLATFAATNTPLDHEGCTVTRAEYTRTEGVGHGTYQFHLGNLGSNLNLRPEGFKISDEKEQGEGSIRVLLDHFGGLACCKCGDLQVGASKMDLNPAWVVLAGTTLFTYESYGDVAPTRSISLDDISKVDVSFRATTPQAPPGTIKLTLGAKASKNLYLACNDNDELKMWAKRLDRKEGEGGSGADFGSAEGKRQ